MPEVIVNSSPLQYLHQIGQIDLFQKLFGRVTVPDAVVTELAAGRKLGLRYLSTMASLYWEERKLSWPGLPNLLYS